MTTELPERSWVMRLPRYSLRLWLGMFLVLSIGFGLTARWYHDIREQGEAYRGLLGRNDRRHIDGAELRYSAESKTSLATLLIRDWIDPDYRRRIDHASYSGREADEEFANRVTKIVGVSEISISAPITARSFARCLEAKSLTTLWFTGVLFEDAGNVDSPELVHLPESIKQALQKAKGLKRLSIRCDAPANIELAGASKHVCWLWLTGQGFAYPEMESDLQAMFDRLATCESLETLIICERMPLKPTMIRDFCEKSAVKELILCRTAMDPKCLDEIVKLSGLERLELSEENMSDDHLGVLKNMKRLKFLAPSPNLSDDAIKELRAALPECKIGDFQ